MSRPQKIVVADLEATPPRSAPAAKRPPVAQPRPAAPARNPARTATAQRAPKPAAPPQAGATPPKPRPPAPAPAAAEEDHVAPVESKFLALLLSARFGFGLAAVAIIFGFYFPTERYLTPETGVGYWLGIIGGSSMLLILLYPLRKRFTWLKVLGGMKVWFQGHMLLGIIGPLLILYHSNFSLGATNSNAALIAMLTVAGSGFVGRYFYTRIHHGLYGRKTSLGELRVAADDLKRKVSGSALVPDLLENLDTAEKRILAYKPGAFSILTRPFAIPLRMYRERWWVTRIVLRQMQQAAVRTPALSAQHERFSRALRRYINNRLKATREVAEFQTYERLFSLWHMMHVPLLFLLFIAGIVHVIAVHVY
ncbi:MAG: hypothetical protein R3E77_14625 [Steroidobacteraceae bacterium]